MRSSTPPLLYTASVCCAWVIQGLTVLCSSFCSSLLLYTASRHTHRLLTGDSSTLHDEEDPRTLEVRDARQAASPLTLRRSGFELRHWPSAVVDFYNDDLIRSQYYPETAELVRAACGAEDVFVFQHMRRDSSALNKESGEEWSYVYDIIMP